MMGTTYRQTQVGWAVIVPLLLVIAITVPVLLAADLLVMAVVVGSLFSLLLLVFGTLTLTIDADTIEARFGIGLIKKRVPLAEIRGFEPATSPWYYGWGIRLYPGGWLYNVSGLESVELSLRDGKRLRFGTAEPHAVCDALRAKIGKLAPLSESDRGPFVAQSRRWMIGVLAFGAFVLVSIGAMFYVESKPPKVTIADDRLAVSGFVYGTDIELAQIETVTLASSLPAIETRTNGFALGTTLRGHFRLSELGDAELYVEADAPPFVVVQHAGGVLIFNAPEPGRTRALHDELVAATQ
jgi:hypothetical protein